jgi:hypothetical protein
MFRRGRRDEGEMSGKVTYWRFGGIRSVRWRAIFIDSRGNKGTPLPVPVPVSFGRGALQRLRRMERRVQYLIGWSKWTGEITGRNEMGKRRLDR